jgi:hypothetical protein
MVTSTATTGKALQKSLERFARDSMNRKPVEHHIVGKGESHMPSLICSARGAANDWLAVGETNQSSLRRMFAGMKSLLPGRPASEKPVWGKQC